jgi:vacuolar-type H+-ATPase subunit H
LISLDDSHDSYDNANVFLNDALLQGGLRKLVKGTMSGIETVKIIVDAEKQADDMLKQAESRATQIRKALDSQIKQERERMLSEAKSAAEAIIQRAEEDGKSEASGLEKESGEKLKQTIAAASARKPQAIDRLVNIILEG